MMATGCKQHILPMQVEEHVVETNDYRFRWAVLQMNHLKRLPVLVPKTIRAALANLPSDLEGSYERAVDRISDELIEELRALKGVSRLSSLHAGDESEL